MSARGRGGAQARNARSRSGSRSSNRPSSGGTGITTFDVLQSTKANEGWKVTKNGRNLGACPDKDAAVNWARDEAQRVGNAELKVHGPDGNIEEQRTFQAGSPQAGSPQIGSAPDQEPQQEPQGENQEPPRQQY